eukprot:6995457-Alexandrium_andersonii.AAC.1
MAPSSLSHKEHGTSFFPAAWPAQHAGHPANVALGPRAITRMHQDAAANARATNSFLWRSNPRHAQGLGASYVTSAGHGCLERA